MRYMDLLQDLRQPLPNGRPHAVSAQTGHRRLADGSLVRVDVELGRFVGTLYAPGIVVLSQIRGSAAEVHAWVDEIVARFPTPMSHPMPAAGES